MGLTDKEIGDILKQIIMVIDTREKKNQHITNWFDQKGIPYYSKKLDSGDYTITLPETCPIKIDGKFVVERKNSIDEIIGNFTRNRDRFQREFERAENADTKVHIVIENCTWRKIFGGSYRSKLPANSLAASMLTWAIRYDSNIWFVNPAESGKVIYGVLYYELREYLKNLQKSVDN